MRTIPDTRYLSSSLGNKSSAGSDVLEAEELVLKYEY